MMRRLYDAMLILLFVLAMALALSASMQLDGPTTPTQRDAAQAASAQARLDKARTAMCGRAGWAEQLDGSTRCLNAASTHPTKLAQVRP